MTPVVTATTVLPVLRLNDDDRGGVFISDDIQDNLAFSDFVRATGARFGVIETAGKFVGIAIKA